MEKYKTCAFLGHRKIDIDPDLIDKLENIIKSLIVDNGVTTFLFGSKSQFNDLCYKLVTKLKEQYLYLERVVYTCKSEGCLLESQRERWEEILNGHKYIKEPLFFYEREVEFANKYVAGKAGYIERNQAMIKDSDICVIYYLENYLPSKIQKSGTVFSYKYIMQTKKPYINVIK